LARTPVRAPAPLAILALLIAAPAADATTHRFAPATDVQVSFQLPTGRASGTLVRFTRNRVWLGHSHRGTLTLHAPGRRPRRVVPRGQRRKRVVLSLSAITGRTKVSVRPRAAAIGGGFVAEVAVVTSSRHRLRRVRIKTAVRGSAAAPSAPAPTASVPPPSSRLFAEDSVWNAPLPANAPLDPASPALVSALRATVAQNEAAATGPWIESGQTTTFYTVPADQPTVRMQLTPSATWKNGLQRTFNAVPIPANARPADGPDAHMTIWQPTTDRLWEFWQAKKTASGWQATFGGAMSSTSSSPGYFDAHSWPGLSLPSWGATATSLPVIAGTMMISELTSGVIPHALAMNIPEARASVYSLPAQRTDGASTSPTAIPEGARFRLDPRLDINALNLPPVTRAMAIAAQRYGIIVRDVTHHAIAFFAENPASAGVNPYTALYGSPYPNAVMKAFPWDHLQLLRMALRTTK
jgi:hypothetical protein